MKKMEEKNLGNPSAYTLNNNAAIMDCSFYLAQPKKQESPVAWHDDSKVFEMITKVGSKYFSILSSGVTLSGGPR